MKPTITFIFIGLLGACPQITAQSEEVDQIEIRPRLQKHYVKLEQRLNLKFGHDLRVTSSTSEDPVEISAVRDNGTGPAVSYGSGAKLAEDERVFQIAVSGDRSLVLVTTSKEVPRRGEASDFRIEAVWLLAENLNGKPYSGKIFSGRPFTTQWKRSCEIAHIGFTEANDVLVELTGTTDNNTFEIAEVTLHPADLGDETECVKAVDLALKKK